MFDLQCIVPVIISSQLSYFLSDILERKKGKMVD